MKITFAFPKRNAAIETQQRKAIQTLSLTRTFVETGDERCPIAGIWMRLADSDSAADDPELFQPAMARQPSWRAFHPLLTSLCYVFE